MLSYNSLATYLPSYKSIYPNIYSILLILISSLFGALHDHARAATMRWSLRAAALHELGVAGGQLGSFLQRDIHTDSIACLQVWGQRVVALWRRLLQLQLLFLLLLLQLNAALTPNAIVSPAIGDLILRGIAPACVLQDCLYVENLRDVR